MSIIEIVSFAVAIVSLVGTIANSFQKRWCFGIWICTNIFWLAYNLYNGMHSQALLYLVNFIFAVNGLVRWKNDKKAPIKV